MGENLLELVLSVASNRPLCSTAPSNVLLWVHLSTSVVYQNLKALEVDTMLWHPSMYINIWISWHYYVQQDCGVHANKIIFITHLWLRYYNTFCTAHCLWNWHLISIDLHHFMSDILQEKKGFTSTHTSWWVVGMIHFITSLHSSVCSETIHSNELL